MNPNVKYAWYEFLRKHLWIYLVILFIYSAIFTVGGRFAAAMDATSIQEIGYGVGSNFSLYGNYNEFLDIFLSKAFRDIVVFFIITICGISRWLSFALLPVICERAFTDGFVLRALLLVWHSGYLSIATVILYEIMLLLYMIPFVTACTLSFYRAMTSNTNTSLDRISITVYLKNQIVLFMVTLLSTLLGAMIGSAL